MSWSKNFCWLSVLFFTACAGLRGVIPTSPDADLAASLQQMSEGRYAAANQLVGRALKQFEAKHNLRGQARAHSILGDIYRDGSEAGLPDLSQSAQHYQRAADIYRTLGLPKWQGFNLFAVAGVQNLQHDSQRSCATFIQAERVYARAPNYNKMTEPFEVGGGFSYAWFARFKRKFGC